MHAALSAQINKTDRNDALGIAQMMRVGLYKAALVPMTGSAKWSSLKAWGIVIPRRCGKQKAIVAFARRLAVILHRMRVDGTDFRWGKETAAA